MLPFHWSMPDLAPFSDEERKRICFYTNEIASLTHSRRFSPRSMVVDSVTQAVGILAAHSRGPRFEVNYGSYTGSDTRVNCR